jgi:hypothetical protein
MGFYWLCEFLRKKYGGLEFEWWGGVQKTPFCVSGKNGFKLL